jgi:hypothetical protein
MRQQRWFRIAVLAVALFAINAVARLVVRLGFDDSDAAQNRATIVMFALVALVLGGLTFIRCQRVKASDWLPDVGPFLSGSDPFANGAGDFFAQIWLYSGCAIAGTVLGYWVAVMLGRDYRSKSLKAFTQSRAARPRRVVGR